MRSNLRRRASWLALAALACVAVCARSDYRLREWAVEDFSKLSQRLAFEAGKEGQAGLDWLSFYPQVTSATVLSPTGVVIGSYRALQSAEPDYSSKQSRNGVQVEITGVLPGWSSLTSELPLMLVTLVLLVMAVPARATRVGPAPSAGAETDWILPLGKMEEEAGNLVLELDAEMRIQQVSRGVERFGYTAAELVGTPMGDFVERFHPMHHQSLLGVAHAAGGRLDSVVCSSSIQNAAGAIEKVVVTLASPSSSEASALRDRYSRLERLCEAICDNALDCVVILDSGSTVIYANASFRRVLGDRAEGVAGLLGQLRPECRLAFTDALQTAIGGGVAGVLELRLESGDALLEGALHALRAPGQRGGTALAVGILRDVSEARRLEAELERARQRAGHSQKIEALGRMAGGVAHDFNNLLATIVFNLEAAKANLEPDSCALPYLEEVELAANKASSVTRQLLLYSRKKPAVPKLTSCHLAIQDAVRLSQGMRALVPIEMRLEALHDSVLLDDGQLDQVLLNLIVNAKDAVGAQGKVLISTENKRLTEGELPPLSAGEYVVVLVSDNGCGIPSEIQAKIFEPYFTTKEVGKGTGLGLSTALAIVEKAGGQLNLLSNGPGQTTFEIWLPVASLAVLHAEPPAAPPFTTSRKALGEAKATVLLVEDEASIRKLLQRMLEQHGYAVTSASTGSAAADILKDNGGFDVLVTDLVLPGLTGPELAKRFHVAHPGRPVLFMSGFPGDTLDETEIGDNSRFLAKPFSHEQFLGSLSQLLGEPAR